MSCFPLRNMTIAARIQFYHHNNYNLLLFSYTHIHAYVHNYIHIYNFKTKNTLYRIK